MPVVTPFRAVLYTNKRPDYIGRVLAPPFDMIGNQRQQLLEASEHNIAWLTVADDSPGYPGVAQRFRQWRSSGVLCRDPQAAFYVYEQMTTEARLSGLFAAVQVGPPEQSGVYPHEDTFAEPIMDRLALMKATHCALEPILGMYTDDTGAAAEILVAAKRDTPLLEAQTPDGALHRLWRLADHRTQHTFTEIMARNKTLIADGHHRWAAANAYATEIDCKGIIEPKAPHRFALMLLVEERTGGVQCGTFHRVIERLPTDVCPKRLGQHLGPDFIVEELSLSGRPDDDAVRRLLLHIAHSRGHVFGCAWSDGIAVVRIIDVEKVIREFKIQLHPLAREFDVALLHDLILKPRLGCRGPFSDHACAITFEKDPIEAWRRVASGAAIMAWFVNPTPVQTIMRAAFAGLRVPQKATHFHPKPPSGIVMYDLAPAQAQ